MKPNTIARRPLIASAIVALLVGGGVYATRFVNPSHSEALAAPAPQAVPVAVRTLAAQKVRIWSEFSGRLQAVDAAEIRPEVSGRITEVLFEDGQAVKAGDVLFVIDPRPYEAAVARAEGNLAQAKTNAGFAKLDRDRAAALIGSPALLQRTLDERANNQRVAEANVKMAEADLARAQLDLEHAHVVAPISGRASRAEITLGNLVQSGPGAPLLTRIVSNDTVYADFEVDEQTYVESVRDDATRRDQERKIPVQLSLPGDKSHVYQGTIYTFDNRLDTASGTIRARAKFDNADHALLPGMFVSVRLAEATERDELLIPDRALGFDQSKKFVYVVGPDNKAAYREVELGKPVQSQRVVTKGVQAGERIIVDGVQHVRPNALVAATEAAPDRPIDIAAAQ
jgi:multidrug efflux system membrane fusion protein